MRTGRNTSVHHIIHALPHGPNIACFFIPYNQRVNFTYLIVLFNIRAMLSYSVCARSHLAVNRDSNIRTVSSPRNSTSQRTQRSSNGFHVNQGVTHSSIHPATYPSLYLYVCPSVCLCISVDRLGGNSVSQDNRVSEKPVIQPSTAAYRSSP